MRQAARDLDGGDGGERHPGPMTSLMSIRSAPSKAIEEQDAKWESVHGISRHDHQRFLNAPYDDFESNAEYVRFMRINELRMKAKKTEEEE